MLPTEDQSQAKDLRTFSAPLQCHIHFYTASTNNLQMYFSFKMSRFKTVC